MKYYANIDLSVENNSHTQAFNFIKKISNGQNLKILEVGCSGGYFGKALVDAGHYVVGVEPDHESCMHANKFLNEVYNVYLDDYFNNNSNEKFDVIIFGDVLEHLVDPQAVLIKSSNFLKNNVFIVASVPNVAHSSIRAMLVEGRWDYAELGLMDKTHLRFFTRSTLIDLFTNASYIIKNINSVKLSAQQVNFLTGMNLMNKSIKYVEDIATDDRIHDFQYVIMATPAESINVAQSLNNNLKNKPSDGLRIMCLVPDPNSTLVDLRLKRPLKNWSENYGSTVKVKSIYKLDNEYLNWADIYILHRLGDAYTCSVIEILKKNNKKIIFDMDDLLTEIPDFLSHHKISEENKINLIKVISEADVLTVSTKPLLDRLKYNENAFIVPNCTTELGLTALNFKVSSKDVKILIASSDLIKLDFLIQPLKFIQEKYNVAIHVIGPPSAKFQDEGLRIISHALFSYDDFKIFLTKMDNTIGVIPLDDSVFSSCKSAIKYYDYSLAGIPSVCSNVLPYSEHIENNINGLLFQNKYDSIIYCISEMIENFELRNSIAVNARNYCLSRVSYNHSTIAWNLVFDDISSKISWPRKEKNNIIIYPSKKYNLIKWIIGHIKKPLSYKKLFYFIKENGIFSIFNIIKQRYF